MNIQSVRKLVAKLLGKKGNDVYIGNLKQALNHGLVLKKVHRVIEFKQEVWEVWLKPYIDINSY